MYLQKIFYSSVLIKIIVTQQGQKDVLKNNLNTLSFQVDTFTLNSKYPIGEINFLLGEDLYNWLVEVIGSNKNLKDILSIDSINNSNLEQTSSGETKVILRNGIYKVDYIGDTLYMKMPVLE